MQATVDVLEESLVNIEYYKGFTILHLLVHSVTGAPWWKLVIYQNHRKLHQETEGIYKFAIENTHQWIDKARY